MVLCRSRGCGGDWIRPAEGGSRGVGDVMGVGGESEGGGGGGEKVVGGGRAERWREAKGRGGWEPRAHSERRG